MTRPAISSIAPFFIVRDVTAAITFYRDTLDFAVTHQQPEHDPFFAIVSRDGAMLMLKAVEVPALPNWRRDPSARWDAYLYVPDPDALAAEFARRGARFSVPLGDTDDGLRGFELRDADDHVLFFGRPRTAS
ncbi:MAG: VOC family protein [Gemmatimonadota bacterium]